MLDSSTIQPFIPLESLYYMLYLVGYKSCGVQLSTQNLFPHHVADELVEFYDSCGKSVLPNDIHQE